MQKFFESLLRLTLPSVLLILALSGFSILSRSNAAAVSQQVVPSLQTAKESALSTEQANTDEDESQCTEDDDLDTFGPDSKGIDKFLTPCKLGPDETADVVVDVKQVDPEAGQNPKLAHDTYAGLLVKLCEAYGQKPSMRDNCGKAVKILSGHAAKVPAPELTPKQMRDGHATLRKPRYLHSEPMSILSNLSGNNVTTARYMYPSKWEVNERQFKHPYY